MKLSSKIQQLSPSITLTIAAIAKQLKQQGQDVISLGAGEPDFNTPEHILEAAKEAMQKGYTKYTPSGGIPELKRAIMNKFEKENRLVYQEDQVTVSVGAKQALYNVFQALLDPGDEVIIPSPAWVSYVEQVKLAGGIPVLIEGKKENQYKITAKQLQEALTERTKAFLLNSPSNPTGMIYTQEELEEVGKVCTQADLCIISDEIYEHLIYDDAKHVSIANLSEDLYRRTIVINGVSKTYAMTGWRVGFAAGDSKVIKAMTDLSSHSTSNPTSIAQYAAVAALNGPRQPIEEMREAFKDRRDYVISRIHPIPGFDCEVPEGAFYAYIDIKELLGNKEFPTCTQWVQALLQEELVAVIPGSAFGSDHHIRISFATSMEHLHEAFDRIERFVNRK